MKNLIAKIRPALASSRLARFAAGLRRRGEDGMAAAEYAVLILVIIAVGGVLFKVFTDGSFASLVLRLIQFIFDAIMKII
jgi:Flp pilus assembly pilin Flp